MKLSEHFTLAEFTASDTAERLRIDNSLPPELLNAAQNTATMMEKIRTMLGDNAIIVISGYRCPDLNRAIGSSDTSDHLKAAAVDFKCPSFGSPKAIAMHLADQIDSLGIGQLIYEFGSWVHVSTRRPSRGVNRIITINQTGTHAGIQGA